MITRVVKLTLNPQYSEDFKELLDHRLSAIRGQQGCIDVDAYAGQDLGLFFTISRWESETDLNRYRQSELFGEIWPKVKTWMKEKPEAYTLTKVE